jgi:HD-GYP domain-containing protein (c-di-GMP phosphodiesterase class II)
VALRAVEGRSARSAVTPWLAAPAVRWLIAAVVPSAAFVLLVQNPSLDIRLEIPWAHLVLVGVVGIIGIVLALLLMRAAAEAGNTRIILLALAFYAIGVFLVAHALLTPGTLLPFATTGTELALLTGFLLCGACLAASGLPFSRSTRQALLRRRVWLFGGVTCAAALVAVAALRLPNLFVDVHASLLPSEQYGDVTALVSGGAGALTFALLCAGLVPYYMDFRLTGLPFYNGMVTGLVLLQVAAVTLTISLVWHLTWWEYHVLLLAGLGVILSGVLREAGQRHNLLEVFGSLLAGDTAGKLEHSYTEVLRVLVEVVEARHAYTYGHSARVAKLAVSIGEALGLAPEQLRRLHQTGVLHDVGKIAVPDALLNRPGPLSPEEFAVMSTHTVVGDQIVGRIPPLAFARSGIRWHHERLDGSGYPDGLRGEAIPLDARIIAVADVYDAMTSERPYRPALGPHVALAELREYAGWKYDPRAVAALMEYLKTQDGAEAGGRAPSSSEDAS